MTAYGTSVGNSLESLQPCNRPALCWTTDCLGCGFDRASVMSSERVGAAALVKSKAPLADYYHCTKHSFNLSVSESSKIVEIRHCFDCIQEAVSFFSFSARTSLNKELQILKEYDLAGVCSTRFMKDTL